MKNTQDFQIKSIKIQSLLHVDIVNLRNARLSISYLSFFVIEFLIIVIEYKKLYY